MANGGLAQSIAIQQANKKKAQEDAKKNAQVVPAQPSWMQQLADKFTSPESQLTGAAQKIMPMYQSRLGGLEGPTEQAMRIRGQQAIQSQYGNALRSAMSQGAAQGMRGAAAQAMQTDIRNQMGQAESNLARDLTIADWDAKRQALMDFYNTLATERGVRVGTEITGRQMGNVSTGYNQYQSGLRSM